MTCRTRERRHGPPPDVAPVLTAVVRVSSPPSAHPRPCRAVLRPTVLTFSAEPALETPTSASSVPAPLAVPGATVSETFAGTGFIVSEPGAGGRSVLLEIADAQARRLWVDTVRLLAAAPTAPPPAQLPPGALAPPQPVPARPAPSSAAAAPFVLLGPAPAPSAAVKPSVPAPVPLHTAGRTDSGAFDVFGAAQRLNNCAQDDVPLASQQPVSQRRHPLRSSSGGGGNGGNSSGSMQAAIARVQPGPTGHDCVRFVVACQASGGTTGAWVAALLVLTRHRTLVWRRARTGRSDPAIADVHLWDLARVAVSVPASTVAFFLHSTTSSSNNVPVATLAVPSLSAVLEALARSLRPIAALADFPELCGVPRWPVPEMKHSKDKGCEEDDEDDEKDEEEQEHQEDQNQNEDPRKWKQSSTALYEAECGWCGERASGAFLRHVRGLVAAGCRTLDLTAAPACSSAACVGFLARDTHFCGLVLGRSTGASALDAAARVLARNGHLTLLRVSSARTDDAAGARVLASLRPAAGAALCALDLAGCSLRDAGALALARAVSALGHGLCALGVAGCGLRARGTTTLLSALAQNLPAALALERLDLSHNALDDSGSRALGTWLAAATTASAAAAAAGAVGAGPLRLRVLRVAHTGLRVSLVPALADVPALAELDIAGARIDAAAVAVLARPLWGLRVLGAAQCVFADTRAANAFFSAFFAGGKCAPTTLCLSGATIGVDSRALRFTTPLDCSTGSLGSSSGSSGSSGSEGATGDIRNAGDLVGVLRQQQFGATLRHVAIGADWTGQTPAEQLLRALTGAQMLEVVECTRPARAAVAGTEAAAACARALAALAAACPRLSVLRVTDGYGPRVVVPLLRRLARNTALRVLDVSGNAGDKDKDSADAESGDSETTIAEEAARLLRHNSTLAVLRLTRCGVRADDVPLLADALAGNTALCALHALDDPARAAAADPALRAPLAAVHAALARNAAARAPFLRALPPHLAPFFASSSDADCWPPSPFSPVLPKDPPVSPPSLFNILPVHT